MAPRGLKRQYSESGAATTTTTTSPPPAELTFTDVEEEEEEEKKVVNNGRIHATIIRIISHPVYLNKDPDCKQWALLLHEPIRNQHQVRAHIDDLVRSIPESIVPNRRVFRFELETRPPPHLLKGKTDLAQFSCGLYKWIEEARSNYERVRLLIHAIEAEHSNTEVVRHSSSSSSSQQPTKTVINLIVAPGVAQEAGWSYEDSAGSATYGVNNSGGYSAPLPTSGDNLILAYQVFFAWLLIKHRGDVTAASRAYAAGWLPSYSALLQQQQQWSVPVNPIAGYVPPNRFQDYYADMIVPDLVRTWQQRYAAAAAAMSTSASPPPPAAAISEEELSTRIRLVPVDLSIFASFDEEPDSPYSLPYYIALYHEEKDLQNLPYYVPKSALGVLPYYLPLDEEEDFHGDLYLASQERLESLVAAYCALPGSIKTWLSRLHDNDNDPDTPIPVGIMNLSERYNAAAAAKDTADVDLSTTTTTTLLTRSSSSSSSSKKRPNAAAVGDVRKQTMMAFLLDKFSGSYNQAKECLSTWWGASSDTTIHEDRGEDENDDANTTAAFSSTFKNTIIPLLSSSSSSS